MHKSKLSVLIIITIILSATLNIQFTPAKVFAQSENNDASDNSSSSTTNADRAKILLERAKKHIERSRLIIAQTTLELLLGTVDSKNVEAQLMLADVYQKRLPMESGDTKKLQSDKILKIAEAILKEDPKNNAANFILAKYYREIFDFDKTIEFAQIVVNAEPKNFDALLILADSYLYSGKKTEALKYYEKAQEINPENADVLIALFDLCDEVEDLDKMTILAEKIYNIENVPVSVKSDICIDTAIAAENDISRKFIKLALKIQPQLNLRLILSAIPDSTESEEVKQNKLDFIDAARVDISAQISLRELKDIPATNVPEVNLLKAILFYHVDEFEQAYEFIKKSEAFDNDDFPEFKEYQAYIAEKNDDLAMALDAFKVLSEREPDEGLYRLKVAMFTRMREILEKLSIDADVKDKTEKLFVAYRLFFNAWLNSDMPEAQKIISFNKALDFDAKNPWINKEKGYIEFNLLFDFDAAIKSYKIANEFLADDASASLSLAICLMLSSDETENKATEQILLSLTQKYPDDFIYRKYLTLYNSIKKGDIDPQAYTLYFKAAYTEDFKTRVLSCEEAIKKQENLFEPLLLWAKLNMTSAMQFIEELRKYDSKTEEFNKVKAKVDEMLQIAEESIKRAIENARNSVQKHEAFFEYAGLLSSTNRENEALKVLDEVVNSANPSADALLLTLNLNLNMHNYVNAHLNAAKLISLYPKHQFVHYKDSQVYYPLDFSKYANEKQENTRNNIRPIYEKDKTYRYHLVLELKNWGGENTEMNLEFRISAKVVEILTPGFYKLELEMLCARGTDIFDNFFDKTFIVEMSDILGLCSFNLEKASAEVDEVSMSKFSSLVLPNITEMFAFAPADKLMKVGEKWIKRTQGGLMHFSDSNEASFITTANEKEARIIRLINAGNEYLGKLAEFKSELVFDKSKNLSNNMTFEYWTLIPDPLDSTGRDRLEAQTSGHISMTLVK